MQACKHLEEQSVGSSPRASQHIQAHCSRASRAQVCYLETSVSCDLGGEIKPILFSHFEQARDSTVRTISLPGVIKTLWSHIYLLINQVPVLAEPPPSRQSSLRPGACGGSAAELISYFHPKKSPARCALQVWEGDPPCSSHRASASWGSRCFPGTGNSKHTQIKSRINPVWPRPLSQQRVWTASMALFLFLPEEVGLTSNSLWRLSQKVGPGLLSLSPDLSRWE